MRLGWKPPNYEFDWKSKARANGWIPPSKQVKLSSVSVGTNPTKLEISKEKQEFEIPKEEKDKNIKAAELLNKKKQKSKLCLHNECIVDVVVDKSKKSTVKLSFMPCLSLFDNEPSKSDEFDSDEFDSCSDVQLQETLQSLLDMANGNNNLISHKLSSESDSFSSETSDVG
ncbi:hypothetical protein GPJ56_008028 [Histomonas meleagridis]|uniref:uncharacterized protein n=1 Tax=Histomonas meleagridis TaxID=135588 RepID=UPI00355AC291|nr:hypothetical protein GPJ56_008028 [Histomonas meleagridis]KAH0804900.1 hypothetical protein GO595_002293 [Histomonas meleagridis]